MGNNSMSDFYNYPKVIAEASKLMPELQGATILDISVQVVTPEYNSLTIATDAGVFEFIPEIGGEIVGIHKIEKLPELGDYREHGDLLFKKGHFQPFEAFIGKQIKHVRMIGEAWNGHGYEISFRGLYEKTMIIGSIYSGDTPKDFNDCLRLGIGTYYWDSEKNEPNV